MHFWYVWRIRISHQGLYAICVAIYPLQLHCQVKYRDREVPQSLVTLVAWCCDVLQVSQSFRPCENAQMPALDWPLADRRSMLGVRDVLVQEPRIVWWQCATDSKQGSMVVATPHHHVKPINCTLSHPRL